MFEVRSVSNLENHFPLPFLFNSTAGKRIVKMDIEFFDYIKQEKFAQPITLKAWPNEKVVEASIAMAYQYMEVDSLNHVRDLLDNVMHGSSLYTDSLHHCKLTCYDGDGGSFELIRYFTIPALASAQSLSPTSQVNILLAKNKCTASVVLDEQGLISFKTFLIVRCKYSDVLMQSDEKSDRATFFRVTKNVANHDMSEIMFFVIGKYTGSQTKMVTYNTVAAQTIAVPQYSLRRSKSTVDNGVKSIDCTLTVESLVWDGLQYVDYGVMFYKNGLSILAQTPTNVNVKFNKKVGQ